MSNTRRALAVRWAVITAACHAIWVSVAAFAYCFLLGSDLSKAGARLLVIDWPVSWFIARAGGYLFAALLQGGYRLPRPWPLDSIWTTALALSFLHSVIGGAFYAFLGACLSLAISRGRQGRAQLRQSTGKAPPSAA